MYSAVTGENSLCVLQSQGRIHYVFCSHREALTIIMSASLISFVDTMN